MSGTEAFLAPLTPGERAVVDLAVYGGTNAEIAGVRGTSEGAVERALSRVYSKLDAGTRGELIALYWQHRLRDSEAAA